MADFLGAALGGLAGGSIGSASVKLYLDSTQYQEQLAAAEGKTKAFGVSAATMYAVAGTAAAAFAVASIQAASEHEQVIAALRAQVGDLTGAYEEQATALQNLTGYEDEQILAADTILARFKLTQQQIQQAIPTVLDYARATGKSVPDAANAVGKALLGNTRALKQVGISYKVTGNATQDYNNILSLLNQKVGGQASAYAQTFAGKLDILKARFNDLEESVGGPLIEELGKLIDSLNQLDAITQKVTGSSSGFGDALHKILVDFNPLVVAINYSSTVIDKFASALGVSSDATDTLNTAVAKTPEALAAEAAAADAASAKMQRHADTVKAAGDTIRQTFLTLQSGTKDIFNVTQKELNKAFNQMLADALRFKKDMAELMALKPGTFGISRKDLTDFEQFMKDQGPGYVDAFLNSSRAKQKQWIHDWQQAAQAVQQTINNSLPENQTIHVNIVATGLKGHVNAI